MWRQVAYWIVIAATAGVYAAMVGWSIPAISGASRGEQVFDLRWTGYGFQEARNFIGVLTPETHAFYLDVQLLLDSVYPALFAVSVGWTLGRLVGASRLRLAVLACDFLENLFIRRMLLVGVEKLTPELVARASALTQLKAVFSLTSVALVAALFAAWAVRRWSLEAAW